MKKIFLILLLLFSVVACELEDAQRAYNNGEYIKSVSLTLSYFEKHPNKVEKIKPNVKNEIMEKFSNIVNRYKTEAGSSDLREKQDGYEGLYGIYVLFDTYSQSSNFTDFLSKYDGDELLSEIYKIIDKRIESRNLESKDFGDIISTLDKYYGNIINYTKNLNEIKNVSKSKILKYESVLKKISQVKADKLIEYANAKEKVGEYRDAQKLNEAAQKVYGKYERNYKNVYTKAIELKEKADYQEANELYQSALVKISYARTKKDYREAIYTFRKAQKIVPNFRDTESKIKEYFGEAYVKYHIFGCNDTKVYSYLNDYLSGIGVLTNSSEAEVKINCRVTDNYQVFTYPSQIRNLSEVKNIINNDAQIVRKEFKFQESITKSVEKLNLSYEIELFGLVNKSYSGSSNKQHEINSLQYLGDVPSDYLNKDKIEKLWGESEMRKKAYENSLLYNDLKNIAKELERL